MPGNGEYDRGEGRLAARELRYWLAGCGIVLLIVVVSFIVYAVLLALSGWHG